MAERRRRAYRSYVNQRRPHKDGATGLVIGVLLAVAIHIVVLPGFGLYLQARQPDAARSKTGIQLVRLSKESWQQNQRVQLEVKDVASEPAPEEMKKADDADAPGQVVSLPPPEKEERPDFAEYASEWNQKTAQETRSQDQSQHAPTIAKRKETGALAPATPPASPSLASRIGSGPEGAGRATSGDSGSDATDGRGLRMFALQVPKQAAREPLQLRIDELNGIMRNRAAIPELPGNGDTARVAMGHRPADAARRSGSGGFGRDSGQGMRGGGDGSSDLPSLAELTPTPQELARLAGAPANDYLPEVELDAETRLNAWRWKHATFFNRIADAIRREWQGGEVLSVNDPGGRVFGFEDRMTIVQVTLDRTGKVVDINVAEESGAWVLDDEAVRAFKNAGPFANPPLQIFKGDAKFTFLFGFNVAYNRQNIDLNWRPN